MQHGLSLTEIYKSFGEVNALRRVSFDVAQGEIVALLGPSGCGKSTLLTLIAGLDEPDGGSITWNGEPVADIPPHLRGFGFMFQDYALFPHMNVFDNIAFGLRMSHLEKSKVEQRVQEALALVGMQGFAQREVINLSGGEQQRVALARSLAPRPHLLMLDEPLGALDRTLREHLVFELGDILHQLHQTAIYVTHDQEEAFAFADRVVLLNAGEVEQIGSPHNIYHQPASEFVARFLGMDNIIQGVVRQVDGGYMVESQIGTLPLLRPASGKITFLLRPDAVSLGEEGSSHLRGRVARRSFRGSACRLTVEVNQTLLTFEFSSNLNIPQVDEMVTIGFDPVEAIKVF